MSTTVKTFLMFEGKAEEAMDFYTSLFDCSEKTFIEKYGVDELGAEGSIKMAKFTVAGHEMMCIDSPAEHAFSFTPSVSLFIDCSSETEFDSLFGALSRDGQILMPVNDYGWSKKFAWVTDRFGVSWQLNIANR